MDYQTLLHKNNGKQNIAAKVNARFPGDACEKRA